MFSIYFSLYASPVAQGQRSCMLMQETWVWPLGGEDPVEQEMATHTSILAWIQKAMDGGSW